MMLKKTNYGDQHWSFWEEASSALILVFIDKFLSHPPGNVSLLTSPMLHLFFLRLFLTGNSRRMELRTLWWAWPATTSITLTAVISEFFWTLEMMRWSKSVEWLVRKCWSWLPVSISLITWRRRVFNGRRWRVDSEWISISCHIW